MSRRPLAAVAGALLAAGLACSAGGESRDIAATVNAVSTSVQMTLAVRTPQLPPPVTPAPTLTFEPAVSPAAATAVPTLPTAATSLAPPSDTPTASATPGVDAAATTSALSRPNGLVYTASFRTQAPQIDGDVSEWSLVYPIRQAVYRAENWTGPADQVVNFGLGWDAQNLYLAAQIIDDVFVQTQRAELLFQGDSLEILLDSGLVPDFLDDFLSGDDYQLGLSPGSFGTLPPEAYLWFPSARQGPAVGVVLAARRSPDGYFVEAAVPWALVGVNAAPELRLGFALSASDNDTPDSAAQQSLISTAAGRRLTDPTTWNTLALLP